MTKYNVYARSKGADYKKKWRLLLIPLVIIIVVLGLNSLQKDSGKTSVSNKPINVTTTAVEGRYLFNGTVMWGRGVEKSAIRNDGSTDYAQPFSQLSTFKRADYDGWVADLECPITSTDFSYQAQVSQVRFNCRPEFLAEASKYFNLFNLANDHTDNQKTITGLLETRKNLEAAKAQYVGSFDPSVSGDICEVIALPIRLQKSDKSEQKAKLPIALCAWNYAYRKPLQGELEAMQKYAKIMPVFALAEMGSEYRAVADPLQQDIAHKIIDQNPEFLIANNPHWIQNTEVYKNKLIVYSTGNFIFDQMDSENSRSASIDVRLSAPYDANVAKWVALAAQCAAFQDDCLRQAEKQGLARVNLDLKFEVVAGVGGTDKITHRADSATQAAVEQRLNWADTIKKLDQ